ncbi:MAG: glycosyltransferase [bacterium]
MTSTRQPDQSDSLFLVLPVPFRQVEGQLLFESQACHGLDQWASMFGRVTVACPVMPEHMNPEQSWVWQNTDELENRDRITLIPMPWGYAPQDHFRQRKMVARQLDEQIQSHRYLQFAIGGYFGDWGAMACERAARLGRKYALWADRVEHEIIARTSTEAGAKEKIKNAVTLPLMKRLEEKVVSQAAVCLFNGNETWTFYKKFNPNSHQLHDIHTKESQYISTADLEHKLKRIEQQEPLEICYMGRVDAMKAPLQWLEALKRLKEQGISFHATWLGDGDLMDEMQQKRKAWGLESEVTLAGFVSDHERVLKTMQQADLFLFTHVTPESPRCLIETLVSGTAMVGYGSEYSQNLIEKHGGGRLVEVGDVGALANAVATLNDCRDDLAELTRQAANNGRRFSDVAAFRERETLLRKYLD